MAACLNSAWPSFVEVVFPVVYLDGTQPDPTDPLHYVSTVTLSQSGNAGATGHPGGKTFHDTCPAYYASVGSGSPINKTDLDALALQLAVDFFNYAKNSYDYVFNGVVNWNAEGITDLIEITHDVNDITTTVMTGPDVYPQEMLHYEYYTVASSSSSSLPGSKSGSTSSSSLCNYYNGPLNVMADVQCINGVINVYKVEWDYDCGLLQKVKVPFLDHTAGCCDCGGTASSGGA